MTDLTFDDYQAGTRETAIGYAQSGDGVDREEAVVFLALALNGEAGEAAEKVKKFKREDDPAYLDDLEAEIGDVLWYLARLADELGVDLGNIAADNYAKLVDRYDRDAITGEGDER